MFKDTFDPNGTLKALKSNRWTRIFFNNRGEVGTEGGEGGGEGASGGAGTGVDFEATPIPADKYSDNPNVAKYKTVGDLIKGHSEVVKMVGAKGVIVPGDNASPQEIEKFYNTLGRPEKADAYKFDAIDKLHPELKITPESEAGFKAFVHKHGLTQKQANAIRGEYYGMVSQALTKRDEASVASKQEAEAALRTEWGQNYDKNLMISKRLVERFGGKEALDAFGELGNNPKVLKFLANLGTKLSEDTIGTVGKSLTMDEGGALEAIKRLEADPAFLNQNDPRHQQVCEERQKMYDLAYGDK